MKKEGTRQSGSGRKKRKEGGKRQRNKKGRKKTKTDNKLIEKQDQKSTIDVYPLCDQYLSTLIGQCYNGSIQGCTKTVKKRVDFQMPDGTDNTCDFKDQGKEWDKCRLAAEEGFSYNVYKCKNKHGQVGVCSNNCKGVDPNAIIIGGSAVLAASGLAGLTVTQAILLGGVLGGGAAAGSQACRQEFGFCRVSWLMIFISINLSFSDPTEARKDPVLQIKTKRTRQVVLPI